MKRVYSGCALVVLLAGAMAAAETVSAVSQPFTFPSFSPVKQDRGALHPSFFKFSGYSPKTGVVSFAWSFPGESKKIRGAIAIYSLSGRMVKSIPLSSASGSAKWDASKEIPGGLYLAKVRCGSQQLNAKFVLCR